MVMVGGGGGGDGGVCVCVCIYVRVADFCWVVYIVSFSRPATHHPLAR